LEYDAKGSLDLLTERHLNNPKNGNFANDHFGRY